MKTNYVTISKVQEARLISPGNKIKMINQKGLSKLVTKQLYKLSEKLRCVYTESAVISIRVYQWVWMQSLKCA